MGMINISGTVHDLREGLWVFNVYNADNGALLYTGCERLKTVTTLRELRRHSLDRLSDTDNVRIELVTCVATEAEGCELVDTLKQVAMPLYGRPGGAPRSNNPVQCVETGEVYDNPLRAAKALGLPPTYIYQHLLGSSSYKTCRGWTFRRV